MENPAASLACVACGTHNRSCHFQMSKAPPPRPIARPTEYEVERLVRYRHEDGHFLVKWVGYETIVNTWEPQKELPPAMVAAWVGGESDGEMSKP